MRRLLRLLSASAQAFLLPQQCSLCEAWVADPAWIPLCGSCLRTLSPQRGPSCPCCGTEVVTDILGEGYLCSRCRSGRFSLDQARFWGRYQGELRQLIHAFKFRNLKRLGVPLAGFLADVYREHYEELDIDLIVPVPMHPRRRRERGFDQTRLLANRLSRSCGTTCLDLVARVRDTRPQFGLDRSERRRNLRGAFSLKIPSGELRGTRILIVDDVMTSGATVEAVGQVLRRAGGADFVAALVVARA